MTFDNEKYKELVYDLQRAYTDKDAHELIIKYVDPSESDKMDNILCIKDVIMKDTSDREFTKGKTYHLKMQLRSFHATNDSGNYHGFDMGGWFPDHFTFL